MRLQHEARRDQARRSLSDHLVEQMHISGFEVTREDKDAVNRITNGCDDVSPGASPPA